MGLKQRVEMVQHAWNRGIKLILCFMVMGKSLMGIRCQSSSVDQTLDQILGGNNWNFQLGSFLHTIAWGGLVPNDDIHRIDGFSLETWMVSNEYTEMLQITSCSSRRSWQTLNDGSITRFQHLPPSFQQPILVWGKVNFHLFEQVCTFL